MWIIPPCGCWHRHASRYIRDYIHPLWHYWLYAVYSLAIAGAVYAYWYRQARRQSVSTDSPC